MASRLPSLALVLLLGVASACDAAGPPPTPVVTGPTAQTRCTVPVIGPVDPAAVLVPGPPSGMKPSDAKGEPLVITGTVIDPDCRPAVGASMNIHHTDARGDYWPADQETCCYYQGTVRTDHNGRFELRTIRPGRYPSANPPPAHIHLEIRHSAGAYRTEMVFATGSVAPAVGTGHEDTYPVVLTQRGGTWTGEAVFVLVR